MATRGTVQFKTSKKQGSKNLGFVYVHHDMYTEGFRDYLIQVFQNNEIYTNNLMTKFVKVINGAEITTSHKIHGDTEFRYTVIGSLEDDGQISIFKRDFDAEDQRDSDAEDENQNFELENIFKLEKVIKIREFLYNPEI